MRQPSDLKHTEQFTVQLGERGRMVLPALIRHRLGLREGDELILTVAGDFIIQLASRRYLARRFKGIYQRPSSKKSVVNEFIAERRREAKHEH